MGGLALAVFAHAAPPTPAMLANACGGCHGDYGVSAGPTMPNLAGQRKEYFVVAMKEFRSGERPSTVMGRLAKGYSDTEIEALADFFAAQKPVRQSAPVDDRRIESGKAVFQKRCKFCHLDNSRLWGLMHTRGEYDPQCSRCHARSGPDAKNGIPIIAGQWLPYLEMQTMDFRNGNRKMSQSKAQKLKSLSHEDLEAVVHFYASQIAE